MVSATNKEELSATTSSFFSKKNPWIKLSNSFKKNKKPKG
jgi:hypothetical protein